MTRAQQVGSRAAALRSAVEAWRALPARARAASLLAIEATAEMNYAVALGAPNLAKEYTAKAAALRAAVKLLREAGRSK